MREKLNGQPALPAGAYLRFVGKQAGLDMDKLEYFAVSMVWRAAVHCWAMIDRQFTGGLVVLNIEALRQYLPGLTPLPDDTYFFVLICTDHLSQVQVLGPFLVSGEVMTIGTKC
jgi:hypothetical protein